MSVDEATSRLNAALEGRYRIERQLGAGGMATVYLADDLKHERSVALKVLKPELAAVVGADRFLAEIKTTANLQHPHILPLHDSGEADGLLFYVMPYVEGESLRERLDRERQLPVDDAVRIATNLAEALDYAHRQGVIHRDIKPANVLLLDGKPVISDFGIALAVGAAGGGRITETGLSLGTPHYMSPEQATGDLSVGAATDVYALGCVLYEMLVAEPPYTGGTPQAILGKIIVGEATPTSKLRPSVPANVDAAVRKALERVPADRFSSASAFAGALADPGFRHGHAPGAIPAADAGPWKLATATTFLVAVVLAGVATWALQRPQPRLGVARVVSPFETGQEPVGFDGDMYSLSPDGSLMVYEGPDPSVETDSSSPRLWVRRWSDEASVPIPGTVNGVSPAVSYDNELVAFRRLDDGEIVVVPLAGGPTRNVAAGVFPRWAPDGDLYFTGADSWIYRVSGGGGQPEVVRENPEGHATQAVSQILPGGDFALWFALRNGGGFEEIGALELATGEVTPIGPEGVLPIYVPSGHVVFGVLEDSTLTAMPFDADRLESGAPVPLVEGVVSYTLSDDGTLVYTTSPGFGDFRSNLLLVDGEGDSRILAELDGMGWFPRYSPDGTRLAFGLSEGPGLDQGIGSDLWVLDVARGARTRVTFQGDNRWYPIWSPDGTSLTYADAAANENRVLTSPADGSGRTETVFELGLRKFPTSWSPDGRTLAYYQGPQGTDTNSRDIWMLHVDGEERREEPFITTPFQENGAIFSPDGRWVLYVSDKAGQQDVYALPFPGPGVEVTISVGGGIEPAWGPDGDAIYYRREGELMRVSVESRGASLTVGTPRRVMADDYRRQTLGGAGGVANYAVAPDGSGFVMLEEIAGQVEPGRFHVVFNWLEELRERVPTR